MAKLEAVIDANITPFERALKQVTVRAEEFGGKMTDLGNDLLKTLSGIDVAKALNIGVAIYAAQKLSDALVGAAKRGLEAFEAYERAVLRFKYTLPAPAEGGAAAGGRAEEIATMAGAKSGLYSAEQMRTAALYLAEASKELRESPEKLNDMLDTIKALALKTGGSPEALAESYRRLIVGIREEGGMAVGKFFKSTPGLEAETEKLRDAHAQAYLHAQGLTDASQANTYQASEYHRIQSQSIADFMTEETSRKGATAVLEEIKGLLERSAPKGIIGETEAAEPGAMLAKAWGGVAKAFGEQLKPAIDDFTRMLIGTMPTIKTDLQSIGTVLNIAIRGIIPVFELLGSAVQLVLGPLTNLKSALDEATGNVLANAEAVSKHVDEVIAQKTAEKEAAEAPEKSAKAALAGEETGIFSKERIKSEEEVAKIGAKADVAHEESQRRIAASRAGMGAIEEEAANRIAKINEAATLRNVERQAAQTKDESEERTAILNRLNAEDQAGEVEKNDIMAEAREKERMADLKNAEEIAKIGIRAQAEHEAAQRRIGFEAAQADLRSAAIAASRAAVIDRPRGATEALDKEYAAQAESAAKIINIKAEAAEKANAAEEEAANRIAKIQEEASLRNVERQEVAGKADSEEKATTLARLNAEDAAGALAINDAKAEAAEKIREADMDAANKIIDAQEEAAAKRIDAEKEAALAAWEIANQPPKEEEAPPGWETFSKFGKHGEVLEGSADRKAREERNREAMENYKREHEIARIGIEREYDERKRQVEDQLEMQRPTQIGLKRTHEVQQEEHVKAIEAEKLRTDADKDFAKQHAGLKLPTGPDKVTGKGDISRSVLAEILNKIFEGQIVQIKEFEQVFQPSG